MKKTALITGAGTGIGRALSEFLIEAGLQVIAVGRRPQPLESLRASHPDAVVAVDGPVLTWLLDCKEFDPLRAIEILKPRMPPGTEVRPSGLETPEIVASGVNKGSGLTEVAKICGVNASDAWVFGDGLNDLDMFGWAGCSVAMGNAHADVVAKADLLAPSNDEDGVAVILESLR